MNRLAFINWLELSSGFSRTSHSDSEWRELMNHAEYIWDYLIINDDDTVLFEWEEWQWGGKENKSIICSFDEFVTMYTNYKLKD